MPGWNLDNSYLSLSPQLYAKTTPAKIAKAELVIYNKNLALELGLGKTLPKELLLQNELETFSQAYAGHQFGGFNILGDGRAHILGEHITPSGKLFDVQLKGSGQTPYSRQGDGKAALAPMLREYIISEAMDALGIPTTRSLAVIKTGDKIYRDKILDGAVLTRIATSHIRFGTFQYAAWLDDKNILQALTDYTINRHYPQHKNDYISFFRSVMKKQAYLVSEWVRIGFVHGVMNTDNMLVSGETIDYGPCAFIDNYSADAVFSSIDLRGRYAFGNQPNICKWNLARFAESLLQLFADDTEKAITIAEKVIAEFDDIFKSEISRIAAAKLGLENSKDEVLNLFQQLLNIMEEHKLDYTNTFRNLYKNKDSELAEWRIKWQALKPDINIMNKANPAVIPRNYLVEEALEAASEGNYTKFHALLKIIQTPYTNNNSEFTNPPPESFSDYKTFCGT